MIIRKIQKYYSLILRILREVGLFHGVEVGVGLGGVEDFVAVHHCYEVFGVGEVDDVVGVAGEHDDALDTVATYLIVEHFVGALLAELY